jgi:hypothetical protein
VASRSGRSCVRADQGAAADDLPPPKPADDRDKVRAVAVGDKVFLARNAWFFAIAEDLMAGRRGKLDG